MDLDNCNTLKKNKKCSLRNCISIMCVFLFKFHLYRGASGKRKLHPQLSFSSFKSNFFKSDVFRPPSLIRHSSTEHQ